MWKRGQPNNQDEQAHPEKFLLRMYIGRYCVCNIFIYIATIRLSNSALDRKCACVDKVTIWYVYMCLIYIYILLQFVYPTPLAYWECDGVDKVACSIYIYSIWHVHMCLIYTYIASIHLPNSVAYWECNCVDQVAFSLYIYSCRCCLWVYSSTQLRLPTGSVLVWTKSLFDTYICVWYIYILPLFVYPTPLAYWECDGVDEVACSIYIYIVFDPYICVWYIHVLPLFDSWNLSHLGYLYPRTTPVMIKLDHNRSCPWV